MKDVYCRSVVYRKERVSNISEALGGTEQYNGFRELSVPLAEGG